MQADFHYYATYCAAYIAGFSHEESLDICYSAQLVDLCSKTFLSSIGAPKDAATTMLQMEMMDARTDPPGLADITGIWSSFHFLPKDPDVKKEKRTRRYMRKYRLICGPDGRLVKDTVELAKDLPLQSAGIAMHVLADTWAHMYFAGTPSLVINNTNDEFYEILSGDEGEYERKIKFRHNPSQPDDLEKDIFTNSIVQRSENGIMNLGHGRAGHLPDYSFMKYRYLPAWDDYRVVVKDNPSDYKKAFGQMIRALEYLKGSRQSFELCDYGEETVAPYAETVDRIIRKRQLIASDDWKEFGQKLSGQSVDDFDLNRYKSEYTQASGDEKDATFLGRFVNGAIGHKKMVVEKLFGFGKKRRGKK